VVTYQQDARCRYKSDQEKTKLLISKKKTRNLSIRRVRLIRLVSGRGPSLRPGRTDVGWYRRAVCIETRLIAAALAVQIPTQVSVGDPAGNTGPNLAWPGLVTRDLYGSIWTRRKFIARVPFPLARPRDARLVKQQQLAG
jgi:hypothetical protein